MTFIKVLAENKKVRERQGEQLQVENPLHKLNTRGRSDTSVTVTER